MDWVHTLENGLIPTHEAKDSQGDMLIRQDCEGSEQNARNPESDKRPLWSEGGVK